MKKYTALALLAVSSMLLLQGCSSSSTSTTTVTTSVTDENGETVTQSETTTVEDGVASTEKTTTVADADGVTATEEGFAENEEEVDLRAIWYDTFNYGAEGVTKNGDTVLMAYDEAPDPTFAALMIIDKDDNLTLYDYGEVKVEGDAYVIYDVDGDESVPFTVTESGDESMKIMFQDGDEAELVYVGQDEIIEDMVSIVESISEN